MKKILFGVAISLLLPGFVSAQTCSARLMGVGMPGEQARIVCGRDANATHAAQYFSNGTGSASIDFSSNRLRLMTTSAHDLLLGRNSSASIGISSSALYSVTTTLMSLGTADNRFANAYINRVIESVSALAAAGSTAADAAAITTITTRVTGSNGTVGVILPAGIVGSTYKVHNSVAGQDLKVYPPTSGTINGGSANANVVVAGKETGFFTLVAANTWVGGVAVDF